MPKIKRILVGKLCSERAPAWQCKLDIGKPLTAEDRRLMAECMLAWSGDGYALAKKWGRKEAGEFKRRWQEQLRGWEKMERRGQPFTLEERKEQQIGLGVWRLIGYIESVDWDRAAWNRFRAEAESFSNADKVLLETAQKSAAARQLKQIGLDYMDRPLRHRQRGEYNQGAWRRLGENEQAASSRQQQQRESWAAARIVGWEQRSSQADDYSFSFWTGGTDGVPVGTADGHIGLRLGTVYEYAREGRKLRGLLLLLNPARNRKRWERDCQISFEGVTEKEAKELLFEMVDALALLAEPLAANLSFAEVWRTKRELVERALELGRFLYNMRTRQGITSHSKLGKGASVELAKASELDMATTANTFYWGGKAPKNADATERVLHEQTAPRHIVGGKENFLVRIDWAHSRDEQIIEGFSDLVKWWRRTTDGGGKAPPEPMPDKKGKKSLVLDKALTCLRAARILHDSSTPQDAWKKLGLELSGGSKDEANYYRYAKEARLEFARVFPFEGEPAHNKTPKRRRR